MPYNSETSEYERRSTTVIDATPDGDTVAVAIDTKLDTAADDAVLDLNHHMTSGRHYPALSASANSRFLKQTPAGVPVWADGVPIGDAVESTLLAASGGSNLVGFLQAGTGAVARTVEKKLQDVVSVKDFGAVGDGVTDTTKSIDDALAVGDSFRVCLPDGVFAYNGVPSLDLTRFTGPGRLVDIDSQEVYSPIESFGSSLSGENNRGGILLGGGTFDIAKTGISSLSTSLFGPSGTLIKRNDSGWTFIEAQRGGSPTVLEVQTGSIGAEMMCASGTGTLTYVSGAAVRGFIVGLPICVTYRDRAADYLRVVSASGTTVTVENMNGTPFAFSTSETVYAMGSYNLDHVSITVSGTQLFVNRDLDHEGQQYTFPGGYAVTNDYVYFLIDGQAYLVDSVATNPDDTAYFQVFEMVSTPEDGTYNATKATFWEISAKTRVKPINGGGDEGSFASEFNAKKGVYFSHSDSSNSVFSRPAIFGVKDNQNYLFFRASSTKKSAHFLDTDDFFVYGDPAGSQGINTTDDYKINTRRDTNSASSLGNTERIGHARFVSRFAGSNHRGLAVEIWNDTGGMNLQGMGYSDAAQQLRLNARGGQILTGKKSTTRADSFVHGQGFFAVSPDSGNAQVALVSDEAGTPGGGRFVGSSNDTIAMRGGQAGFVNDFSLRGGTNNDARLTVNSFLVLDATYDGVKALIQVFGLPTSSAGLPSKTLWSNSNVLNITP